MTSTSSEDSEPNGDPSVFFVDTPTCKVKVEETPHFVSWWAPELRATFLVLCDLNGWKMAANHIHRDRKSLSKPSPRFSLQTSNHSRRGSKDSPWTPQNFHTRLGTNKQITRPVCVKEPGISSSKLIWKYSVFPNSSA